MSDISRTAEDDIPEDNITVGGKTVSSKVSERIECVDIAISKQYHAEKYSKMSGIDRGMRRFQIRQCGCINHEITMSDGSVIFVQLQGVDERAPNKKLQNCCILSIIAEDSADIDRSSNFMKMLVSQVIDQIEADKVEAKKRKEALHGYISSDDEEEK